MDREQRSSASRRSSGTNAETLVRATTRSHDADHGSTPSPVAEHTAMAIEDSVIAILTDLHHELHPGRHLAGSIAPDASLDSVFALDSLGRAEMIQRLERAFAVTLPDDLMVNAERLHDLVDAIGAADPSTPSRPGVRTQPARSATRPSVPEHAKTINEALEWHAEHNPDFAQIVVHEDDGSVHEITYAGLAERAASIAVGLAKHGVGPGDSVSLMLPTGRDYFAAFAGILSAGAVPVPIYPPVRPSQLEAHLVRHERILANAEAKALVTVPEAKVLSRMLQSHVPTLGHVVTTDELDHFPGSPYRYPVTPEHTALLQYTSGSTGDPKGVILSHANLIANIRIMGQAIDISPSDTFVSWLPLYHDMGLIGAWLGMLVYGVRLVCMSPLTFLRRPSRWLQCMSDYQGTLSAAPNFAYEMCAHKVDAADLEGVDLSAWRMAFNGAEPVSPRAARAFCERFAGHGFDAGAMAPVYGLAECSLGLAFPPLGRGLVVDTVSQPIFAARAYAEAVSPTTPARSGASLPDSETLEFVACGSALPGYQIRIVDDEGLECTERHEGHVQFQGPSATAGYRRNSQATEALFDGEWLDTGDLGYLANNDLFITRRAKDMIIRAGRNLFPYELEEAAGDIEGIRKGCVAVFGSNDPTTGTERVVVLAEVRGDIDRQRADLVDAVQAAAQRVFGAPVDDVVLAPPFSVLKTSSGKIRRSACRERYEKGSISDKPAPLALQLGKLALASAPGLVRRWLGSALKWGYATYVWVLIGLLALIFIPLALIAPTPNQRWHIARFATRRFVGASGLGYDVRGREHIPDGPCLLVANHASYMDWLVLLAAIPTPFSFVAKSELNAAPGIGLLLRRLSTEFVDRENTKQSVLDAERVAREAKRGQRLLVFPEGTFQRAPGVLPFRMGAFLSASQADIPVVPIGVRGTRAVLRDRSWRPRHGTISITFAPPIAPVGENEWSRALGLRDAAHEVIVGLSGETALGHRR